MKLIHSIIGIVLFLISLLWGWATNTYLPFVTMVIGYWLFFAGLNSHLHSNSFLSKYKLKAHLILILYGAFFGLVLDFFMLLSKIIVYHTMDSIWNIFLLYLGWGVSLPAMIESYIFFKNQLGNLGQTSLKLQKKFQEQIFATSFRIGVLFIALVMLIFVHSSVKGNNAILLFFGTWLILEHFLHKLHKTSMLQPILEGDCRAPLAIALAATIFCFAWEGMNVPMHHWSYANLFWLKPKILGVSLVAFFGYFCWYALYLSAYRLFFNPKHKLW